MTTPVYIDPFHDILRGSTTQYTTTSDNRGGASTTTSSNYVGEETVVDEGTINYGPPTDTTPVLQAPTNVVVKSRSIRFTADGRQVVDLVLTVDNVVGATRYEVRVSKE